MPNYDFHNCFAPREFEEFVKDVLEIREKVTFEISGRGQDGGIDLLYWEDTTKIIVQVKCFQKNFNQLFTVLKNKEVHKAKSLNPTRYILVISFTLEVQQRNKILELYDNLIRKREDIIDSNDLNSLLAKELYHNVERTHYKLWLSSTNVLTTLIEEVVHRGILVNSKFELAAIKKTIPIFVQNPSFVRALNILERNRYVLISGEPGIGKTTLGRCLAAYYLQRLGYMEFIYVNQVSDALNMYKEDEKQVFFFDDFWGDIFKDEKHPHNEEKHLLKFIQRISESRHKIFILTSREYVLQQGFAEYHNEQLKNSLNIGKSFIQLEDYSDLIKAKILFNHLYFSEKLEWDYVEVIANGYERIISHQNYHPRMIEDFFNQGTLLMDNNTPREFYRKFLDYLNDPYIFWKDIFMKQTYGARLTALILLLSTQPTRLEELQESFYSCSEAARQNYIPIEEEVFKNIIDQLEKTMIVTQSKQRTLNFFTRLKKPSIVAKFQNPSIKDFLYRYLTENIQQYGKILIQGCPFINQLLFMFKTTESKRYIDEDMDEDALYFKEKVFLPNNLGVLLANRIISEFDTLKYSYVEEDPYMHKPSVYVAPEDCIVRKLYDIVFNFGVNESTQMNAFIIGKVKLLCTLLHDEDYPFSYDDMVIFPFLIKYIMPLRIGFDRTTLINDYYARSRFAEHLLMVSKFQEVFPKEYNDFKKANYKKIKSEIKWLLLDDVDFFASDGEDERIGYLIDMVYPQILECYKLRDSKSFWNDYRMIDGYFYNMENNDEDKQREAERLGEKRIEEEMEKKTEAMIRAEKEALLGVREKLSDEEIIDFINKNISNDVEAVELIYLYKNESPWYIWPFFSNWSRLSLFVAFYQKEKRLPFTSASFYEQLTAYLIKGYDYSVVNSLYEMFLVFAMDMMENGQTIFSKRNIEEHVAFRGKLDTGEIDLSMILAFPFFIQRGKWYEFCTPVFQAYLSLKKFMSFDEEERIDSYGDFLELNGCFMDREHDIWLLCAELDLQNFNQYYVIPMLKEYLAAIDISNPYTVCSSTLRFFDIIMDFKISSDKLIPEVSGTCFSGSHISLLDFIDKDLLEIEYYMSYLEEEEDDSKKKYSDLLHLSHFISQEGLEASEENEYTLDLAKYSENHELLDILASLGVCDYLWEFYYDVLKKVEQTEAINYNIRLDHYLSDPKTRIYAFER